MTTTTRDPRIDPQAGDMIRTANQQRHYCVYAVGGDSVRCFSVDRNGMPGSIYVPIAEWREWSKADGVYIVAGVAVDPFDFPPLVSA